MGRSPAVNEVSLHSVDSWVQTVDPAYTTIGTIVADDMIWLFWSFKQVVMFLPDDMPRMLCGADLGRTICWDEEAVAYIQVAQLAELCKSCKHVCIGLPLRLCSGAAECHPE